MKTSVAVAALTLAGVASLSSADTLLYGNTFERGALGAEWSSNSRLNTEARPTFTKFNGRYSTGYTQLTLPALPALRPPAPPPGGGGGGGGSGPQWYEITLSFDFYCLDSWDGNVGFGPDHFRVLANNEQILRYTFSNQPGCPDTFPGTPDLAGQYAFNDRWIDSIYRGLNRTFTSTGGSNIVIRWEDEGLQGMTDESWGIDNVNLTYRVVPAPATAMLGALGGCVGLRRRRK